MLKLEDVDVTQGVRLRPVRAAVQGSRIAEPVVGALPVELDARETAQVLAAAAAQGWREAWEAGLYEAPRKGAAGARLRSVMDLSIFRHGFCESDRSGSETNGLLAWLQERTREWQYHDGVAVELCGVKRLAALGVKRRPPQAVRGQG